MAVDKLVDSTQLNTDLTAVANAIRTKGGTSAQLAFPGGFVSAIGDIETGGYQTPYQLGGFYAEVKYEVEIIRNRVKFKAFYSAAGDSGIGLRDIPKLNISTWFTINAGDTVTITYSNVENESSIIWNANLKQANSQTSLQYGIGNDTHLNGATVTAIPTSTQDIGCLFLYVSPPVSAGDVLSFDVEISVNGVRYV